jgi:HAMP domain-containing protein
MSHETQSRRRGWSGLGLQSRLYLVFTLLFVFTVLVLSLMLNNVIQMMRINQQAQAAFESHRQAYRFQSMLMQLQLALQNYENTASGSAEANLDILQSNLERQYSALYALSDEDYQAQFDAFADDANELIELSAQIIESVDAEDWDGVLELHDQASAVITRMDGIVEEIRAGGLEELQAAQAEAEVLQMFTWIVGMVAIPLFLVLAGLAAVVIYRQIHQPLDQLSEAARALQNGSYQLQSLEDLTGRGDELGGMARQFVRMATAVEQRTGLLQQEAESIRARIR